MAEIDIDGGVAATTLNGSITSGTTSITVTDGTGWPTGAGGNFYAVIDRGLAAEEVLEFSSRSSNTLTAATRGADGTSASAHDDNATIEHVVPALALQEANTHANQTTGTPHGSAYVTSAGNVATATALATGRTISLTGDVTGTSGSFDGTGNASITATVGDDSHDHATSITGTAADLTAWGSGLGLAFSTWTPTLAQSASITLTVDYAKYVQIGKLIFAIFRISATSAGTASNSIELGGLPVTPADVDGMVGTALANDSGTTNYNVTLYGQTTSAFRMRVEGTTTPLGGSFTVASGDFFQGYIAYEAA